MMVRLTDGLTMKSDELTTFAIPSKTLDKSIKESEFCKLVFLSDESVKDEINDPICPTFSAVIYTKIFYHEDTNN